MELPLTYLPNLGAGTVARSARLMAKRFNIPLQCGSRREISISTIAVEDSVTRAQELCLDPAQAPTAGWEADETKRQWLFFEGIGQLIGYSPARPQPGYRVQIAV